MYRILIRVAAVGAAMLAVALWGEPALAAEVAAEPAVVAVNSLPVVINNLIAWIVGIAFAVATLFATIAGLLYLSAGGDPAQVDRAKTAFKSAVIGYAIALLAPVLLTIAKNILGG